MDLASIHPGHNREGPKHPTDTNRHPHRHPQTPPDTPTHRRFYALEVTGRTMQYLSVMTKYDFYWIASIPDSIHSHPNTLKTPSRHLTDTPKLRTFWLWEVTGRKGNSLI